MVPTRSEFVEAVRADEKLQEVKRWLEAGVVPTADILAAQSARVKRSSLSSSINSSCAMAYSFYAETTIRRGN